MIYKHKQHPLNEAAPYRWMCVWNKLREDSQRNWSQFNAIWQFQVWFQLKSCCNKQKKQNILTFTRSCQSGSISRLAEKTVAICTGILDLIFLKPVDILLTPTQACVCPRSSFPADVWGNKAPIRAISTFLRWLLLIWSSPHSAQYSTCLDSSPRLRSRCFIGTNTTPANREISGKTSGDWKRWNSELADISKLSWNLRACQIGIRAPK